MIRSLAVGVALALVLACGTKKTEERGPAPVAAVAEPEAPPAAPLALLGEPEVRAVVDAWLTAQNAGDFARYEALYAARFTGVKRVGSRVATYDRAGWMKDRERMFGKKTSVELADLRISLGAKAAVAFFTQTWASGSYKDVGPKQLVVVVEGEGLRIAREELLASKIVGDGGPIAPLARDTFAFALEAGGRGYLVLDPAAQAAWATGEPTLVARGTPAIASYAVDPAAVPEPWRAWVGKPVALFPTEGRSCSTTVDELRVLSGFQPHFGTLAQWAGGEGEGAGAPATDAQVLQEIASLAGGTVLVAALRDRCANALWGRVDDKNVVPRLVVQRDRIEEIVAAAGARFRSLKGYAAVQRVYTEQTGAKTAWDEHDGAAPSIAVFYDRKVQRHFVAVAASAGAGCGGFDGEFWALFQVVPRKTGQELVLLTDESDPGPQFFPVAVVDADADGDVEFVGSNTLVRLVGTVYRVTDHWTWPNYDCPC